MRVDCLPGEPEQKSSYTCEGKCRTTPRNWHLIALEEVMGRVRQTERAKVKEIAQKQLGLANRSGVLTRPLNRQSAAKSAT
jgi:hypothetical protein